MKTISFLQNPSVNITKSNHSMIRRLLLIVAITLGFSCQLLAEQTTITFAGVDDQAGSFTHGGVSFSVTNDFQNSIQGRIVNEQGMSNSSGGAFGFKISDSGVTMQLHSLNLGGYDYEEKTITGYLNGTLVFTQTGGSGNPFNITSTAAIDEVLIRIEPTRAGFTVDDFVVTLNIPENPPTGAPGDITIGGVTATTTEITNWGSAAGGADGYVLYANSSDSWTAPSEGENPSADLSWNNTGQQVIYVGTSIPTSVILTGLTENNTYYYKVYAYNQFSSGKKFETTGSSVAEMKNKVFPFTVGQSNDDDYFTNVTFGDIVNTSVKETDGYGDYTSQSTSVAQGAEYSISFSSQGYWTESDSYSQEVVAWFDWNQDFDFDDEDEKYILGTGIEDAGPHSANITVPETATLGSTRMRIVMEGTGDLSEPQSTSTDWGEAEDYMVTVIEGAPDTSVKPSVSTLAMSDISMGSATGNGNITDLGGKNVTERGIYYSTTDGFADGEGTKVVTTGDFDATGVFNQPITGLAASTTYYAKAFATNSKGTNYGEQVTFTTLDKYTGGEGTKDSPYQIATVSDLINLSNIPEDWVSGKYFVQTADINFDSDSDGDYLYDEDWNGDGSVTNADTVGFSPIGNSSVKFQGNYDGKTYTITGLSINIKNATTNTYAGMFGYTYGGMLDSISLVDNNINVSTTSSYICYAGSLAGYADSINNCSAIGVVNAASNTNPSFTGGLVGYNVKTVTNSCAKVTVTANSNGAVYAGGLVGYSKDTVSNCYATGDAFATTTGSMSSSYAGGLVAYAKDPIVNSYATGAVSSVCTNAFFSYVGGLAGSCRYAVINCYATGAVSYLTGSKAGGLIGDSYVGAGIANSYYDSETTGMSADNNVFGTPLTTEEFTVSSNFVDWFEDTPDEANPWIANPNGRPYLYSQELASAPTVTTAPMSVINISTTTATANGDITDLGSEAIIAHGVCWSTNEDPTIENSKVDSGAVTSTGTFTAAITGLDYSTTYYIRAYATSSAGTSYGDEEEFTTLDSLVATTIDLVNASSETNNDGSVSASVSGGFMHPYDDFTVTGAAISGYDGLYAYSQENSESNGFFTYDNPNGSEAVYVEGWFLMKDGDVHYMDKNLFEGAPPVQNLVNVEWINPTDASDLIVVNATDCYSYSWTGPNDFTADVADLENLAPGKYELTVTDKDGNTDTTSVVVGYDITVGTFNFTGEGVNVTITGPNDFSETITAVGSITLTGGVGQYTMTNNTFSDSFPWTFTPASGYEGIASSGTSWSFSMDNYTITEIVTSISAPGNSALSVYPNPATTMLTLKGNTADMAQVTLYALDGKIALGVQFNDDNIDVSSLSAGIYLLIATNHNGEALITERIIISE